MKLIFAFIFSWISLIFQSDSGIQPKKITDKWFPDPDIVINTPAFKKKSGFTNHREMMTFLENLKLEHPQEINIEWIGESQKGKLIPLVRIKTSSNTKLKVWLQGGLHGDEPASTEGILYLLGEIFKPENKDLLNHFEWAIVPMANIDGYENHDRYAANGLDLNRDQTKLMIQESISLKKALCQFEPDLALDFHEFRPYRKDFLELGTAGLGSAYDVMILNSSNLNVPQNQREITQNYFVNPLMEQLSSVGYRAHDYFTTDTHLDFLYLSQGSSNARSSATSFALTGAISTLFEIRGVGLGRTSFKRRTHSTYLCAKSYLESAVKHSDEILEALNHPSDNNMVVIKTQNAQNDQSVLMVDLFTKDTTSIILPTKDAKNLVATKQRKIPQYYLVHPSAKAIIDRLSWFQLSHDTLTSAQTLTMETFQLKESCEPSPIEFEGVYRQDCDYDVVSQTINLPAGTLRFPVNQRKGRILLEILEPDAPNSLMSYQVLNANQYPVLPYYRLPYYQPIKKP
jgi:hypothetical protein